MDRRHLDRRQVRALRGAPHRDRRTHAHCACVARSNATVYGPSARSRSSTRFVDGETKRDHRRASCSDGVRIRWVTRGVRERSSRGSPCCTRLPCSQHPSTRWLPTGASSVWWQHRAGARSNSLRGGRFVVSSSRTLTASEGVRRPGAARRRARDARCSHPRAGPSPHASGGLERDVKGCIPFMATGFRFSCGMVGRKSHEEPAIRR